MEKLEQFFRPIATYLATQKIIRSISRGMMMVSPLLIFGGFGAILNILPIEGYQNFITTIGLKPAFSTIVNVTTNMLALYAVFTITYMYVKETKHDSFMAGVIALMSFLMVTPLSVVGEGREAITSLPIQWLGAQGVFVAMFVAISTSILYVKIMDKGLIIKMPESVPEFVIKTFNGIVPAILIGSLFAIINAIFSQTPFGDFHNAVYSVIGLPLKNVGSSIWVVLLITTLAQLCWFLGIHGVAITSVVMPIWVAAGAENLAATSTGVANSDLPNIVTMAWTIVVSGVGGAGATLGLLFAILIFGKSKRYKIFAKVATIPSFFGINEPIVFGLPIMLNPIMFIPFVILPNIFVATAYALTNIGVLPKPNGISALQGTPVFFNGFIVGGWQLVVYQIVVVIVAMFAYLPFFKILDNKALEEERQEEVPQEELLPENSIKNLASSQ